MLNNILTCDRVLGCAVLYDGTDQTPPMATDYFKFSRKKGYSNYLLYSSKDVIAELYVNSTSMILLYVELESQGNGKCQYHSKIIELDNDIRNLTPLLRHLIPSTNDGGLNNMVDHLMLCIMRDIGEVIDDKSCSNCVNKECLFRNTGEVCYFER